MEQNINNLDRIRDNLFIGNGASVSQTNVDEHGITAVLNVAYELDDPLLDPKSVKQIKIGLMDNFDNNPIMKNMAVDVLKQLFFNGETVLVHCAMGASRSVYVAVRALAEIEEKSQGEIVKEVIEKRPVAFAGPLFGTI